MHYTITVSQSVSQSVYDPSLSSKMRFRRTHNYTEGPVLSHCRQRTGRTKICTSHKREIVAMWASLARGWCWGSGEWSTTAWYCSRWHEECSLSSPASCRSRTETFGTVYRAICSTEQNKWMNERKKMIITSSSGITSSSSSSSPHWYNNYTYRFRKKSIKTASGTQAIVYVILNFSYSSLNSYRRFSWPVSTTLFTFPRNIRTNGPPSLSSCLLNCLFLCSHSSISCFTSGSLSHRLSSLLPCFICSVIVERRPFCLLKSVFDELLISANSLQMVRWISRYSPHSFLNASSCLSTNGWLGVNAVGCMGVPALDDNDDSDADDGENSSDVDVVIYFLFLINVSMPRFLWEVWLLLQPLTFDVTAAQYSIAETHAAGDTRTEEEIKRYFSENNNKMDIVSLSRATFPHSILRHLVHRHYHHRFL